MLVGLLSDAGCVRDVNEDSVRVVRPADAQALARRGLLAVVCDGMGGHAAGETASRLAADVVARCYADRRRRSRRRARPRGAARQPHRVRRGPARQAAHRNGHHLHRRRAARRARLVRARRRLALLPAARRPALPHDRGPLGGDAAGARPVALARRGAAASGSQRRLTRHRQPPACDRLGVAAAVRRPAGRSPAPQLRRTPRPARGSRTVRGGRCRSAATGLSPAGGAGARARGARQRLGDRAGDAGTRTPPRVAGPTRDVPALLPSAESAG